MGELAEMKSRYRIMALLGLALGPAACGRGCTCFEGEKTYEKVKGKYEVSLVRKTHWTGGRIPGPVSNFYIHVATNPPIYEAIGDCTHADMKEDEQGKYVGFRCQDTHEKEWTVLRLRGSDRRIRECGATVGTGDEPDWKKLESVRSSTARVLGCRTMSIDESYAMEQLAKAVLEDEGSPAAADYVSTLAALGSAPFPDPWDSALKIIDEPTRKATLAKVCPVLAQRDVKTEPVVYVRAARHCPLESGGALTMLRAILAKNPPPEDTAATAALFWSGLLAAKAGPKDAKQVGDSICLAIDGRADKPWNATRETIGAELLGHTKVKCEAAVRKWLENPPCTFNLDCDGGLCNDAELATDLAGWDDGLDAGVRADPAVPIRERAILRAMYVSGLTEGVTVPNARRLYARPDAGALPYCNDTKVDAGAECQCWLSELRVCRLAARETEIEESDCTVHIDDKHKRLDVGHRVCVALGADCSNHPCCGEAQCHDRVCVMPAPRDAGAD